MKKLFIIIAIFFLSTNVYAAGGSGGDGQENKQSNYKSAVNYVKAGKKLEKKGKIEKAKVKYEKAFKRLLKANDKDPSNPDVLNYLGFALRKTGKFKEAEKYYLAGLKIKPDHNGINEYLGELYVNTNRMDLAKERLAVLKNCNCEEYSELKEIIEKK